MMILLNFLNLIIIYGDSENVYYKIQVHLYINPNMLR